MAVRRRRPTRPGVGDVLVGSRTETGSPQEIRPLATDDTSNSGVAWLSRNGVECQLNVGSVWAASFISLGEATTLHLNPKGAELGEVLLQLAI